MGVKLLVVARYNEPLHWLADLPLEWRFRVVQKGWDAPNTGREASSYAWWCETQHIEPDGTYGFVQGDPFDHGFDWSELRAVERYTPMGDWLFVDGPDGRPNHPHLPLLDSHLRWVGPPAPQRWAFVGGAQFLVPGHVLLSRPRTWWAELRQWADTDPHAPWVLERLWSWLLGVPAQPPSPPPSDG